MAIWSTVGNRYTSRNVKRLVFFLDLIVTGVLLDKRLENGGDGSVRTAVRLYNENDSFFASKKELQSFHVNLRNRDLEVHVCGD